MTENCFKCIHYQGDSDQGMCSRNGWVFSNSWCRSFEDKESYEEEEV